jgi:hypothetical protein
MSFKPPCPVTKEEITINVEDLEPILRPPESKLLQKLYPPRLLPLPDGRKMVVRMAKREEIPVIIKATKQLLDVEKDFYDVVAARVLGEILAWLRYRVKDHYCLIGVLDGELAAIANARLMTDKVAISLHTMTFKRGAGIGAIMYLTKMEHAFDFLGIDEWWATYESYTGIRYWGLRLAQHEKPYPEIQHELGGARVYFTTREQWDSFVKPKFTAQMGQRPVPEQLLRDSEKLRAPEKVEI